MRLIGVCFERMPRYIVLELLSGGDLKNFLRDNRPKGVRIMFCTQQKAFSWRCLSRTRRNCLFADAQSASVHAGPDVHGVGRGQRLSVLRGQSFYPQVRSWQLGRIS